MKKTHGLMLLAIFSFASSLFAAAPVLSSFSSTNVLEDFGTLSIPFTVTDADSSIFQVTVTATASSTNLVDTVTASGSGTNRTLNITSIANASGTNTITVIATDEALSSTTNTFILRVAAVDDAPAISSIANRTILEEGSTNISFTVSDVDTAISNLTVTATISPTNLATISLGGASTNATKTITVAGLTNANGTGTITISARDATSTNTTSFTVVVTPVNDAPSYTLATNLITVVEDSGRQTNANFVTSVSAGATNESQTLSFTLSQSIPGFLSTVTLTTNGVGANLVFQPAANVTGTNIVTVQLKDNGDAANGGTNGSPTQTFTVVVTPVNDAPTISLLSALNINEDSGVTNVSFTVADVDTDITNILLTLSSTTTNTNIATVTIGGSGTNRTLIITTLTNGFGSVTNTLIATDGSLSTTNKLILTVNPVNDAPSFTLSTNLLTVAEDAGLQSITNFAENISKGPTNELSQGLTFVVTTNDGSFFSIRPTINASGTLTYQTGANINGTNVVSIKLTDTGGTSFGGVDSSATNLLTIVVSAASDAPVISGLSTAASIIEDAGTTNFGFIVTDADSAITNVTVSASTSDTNLVSVSLGGSGTNRTLIITPVADAFGTVTNTLIASDGSFSSTNLFVLTLLPANDAPSFTASTNILSATEDAGFVTVTNFAQSISRGPTNESSQSISFLVTVTNSSFFLTQPTINTTNGNLTYQTATNVFGTNTISVRLQDSGGVANGGTNSSTSTNITVIATPVNDAPVLSIVNSKIIFEDVGTTNIEFTVSDVDNSVSPVTVAATFSEVTSASPVTVVATSSDTNLVTVSVSGTGTNRILSVVTATNAFGLGTITLVADDGSASRTNTMALTVLAVNDAPGFTIGTNYLNSAENEGLVTVTNFAQNISRGPTNESSQTLTFVFGVTNTSFFATQPSINSTNGTLTYKTGTNVFGTNVIQVRLTDSGGTDTLSGGTNSSAAVSVTIAVSAVNGAPVLTIDSSKAILEDSGTNTMALTVSDVDNSVTSVTVTAQSSNTNLVNVSVIGTSTNRTLQIVTVTNAFGSAVLTLVASDGVLSRTNTVTLTVDPVNDAPSFTTASNTVSAAEDAGLRTIAAFAQSISRGPTNENAQTLTFSVTTTNISFFALLPSINTTNGTLTYKTGTNVFGTNVVSVRLTDSGNSSFGGTNGSVVVPVTIIATPVNDAPIMSIVAAKAVNEDSGTNTVSFTVVDPDAASGSVTVSASIGNTNLATVGVSGSGTNRNLNIVTVTNAFGTTTVTLIASDGTLRRTNTVALTVSPADDPPSFTLATNVLSAIEDSGLRTITNFAQNISRGPTNENSQTLAFLMSTTNSAFFSTLPFINPTNGTLTYRTATNAFGTNVVSVRLTDNGGSDFGGTNSSAAVAVTFIAVGVNDAPLFPNLTAKTIREDSGTNSINIIVVDTDGPASSIDLSATSSNTNIVKVVDISGTDTNRTLRVETAHADTNGVVTITLVATDGTSSRTNSFALTVAAVNDAPTFSLSTNQVTVQKFGTIQTVSGFATSISKGPANESTQSASFSLTTTNAAFFSIQPSINTNGVLTYAAGSVAGTNTVTVKLTDSGGTSFGGTNGSVTQDFVVICPPNPYTVLAGTFNGLFYRTNGVANDSAGFFTFIMTTNGAFTGQIKLTNTYSFTGQFNTSGRASFTVARSNMTSLTVVMNMDLSDNFTEQVNGTVNNGSGTSVLLGDRATFNATDNIAPYFGKYTMILPGSASGSTKPAGNGYGLVTVTKAGVVTLSGVLADGTAINQSTSISKDGVWPFYASGYSGKGVVLGWLNLTTSGTNWLSGDVSWIKTGAAGGAFYRSGFTNDITVQGSFYTPPASGARAINLSSGTITAANGSLTSSFVNRFSLSASNVVTMTPTVLNSMTLTVTPASGFFSGTFTHPVTKLTTSYKGVILQDAITAKGFFLSTNLSGSILIR